MPGPGQQKLSSLAQAHKLDFRSKPSPGPLMFGPGPARTFQAHTRPAKFRKDNVEFIPRYSGHLQYLLERKINVLSDNKNETCTNKLSGTQNVRTEGVSITR